MGKKITNPTTAKGREKKAAQDRRDLKKEYEETLAELEAVNHTQQIYPAGSQVTIPGDLFVRIINTMAMTRDYVSKVQHVLHESVQAMGVVLDQEDFITSQMMKAHLGNIKAGVTETRKEEPAPDKELAPEDAVLQEVGKLNTVEDGPEK